LPDGLVMEYVDGGDGAMIQTRILDGKEKVRSKAITKVVRIVPFRNELQRW